MKNFIFILFGCHSSKSFCIAFSVSIVVVDSDIVSIITYALLPYCSTINLLLSHDCIAYLLSAISLLKQEKCCRVIWGYSEMFFLLFFSEMFWMFWIAFDQKTWVQQIVSLSQEQFYWPRHNFYINREKAIPSVYFISVVKVTLRTPIG